MSLMLNGLLSAGSILRTSLTTKVIPVRFMRSSFALCAGQENDTGTNKVPLSKDRSVVIPVETSIRYLLSSAYKETYGDNPVWKLYRRNHKGEIPPRKTRKMCIRNNVIATGNPCPICRDEYLIVDYRNVNLLKQFISEHSGEILSYNVTGVCQKSYDNLLVAILKARDCGLLTFDVPIRYYNYNEWSPYAKIRKEML